MKSKKPKMPKAKLTKRQIRLGKTAAKISLILAKSGLTTQESTTALLALVQYGMTRLGVTEMTIGSDAGHLFVQRTATEKTPEGKKPTDETLSYIR